MAVKTIKSSRLKNRNKKLEYITDTHGKKTKVVLPIEDYQNLVEDLYDLAVVAGRKNERTISFDEVLKSLKSNGKL